MSDFFFGSIDSKKITTGNLYLDDLLTHPPQVNPSYYTKQLNRLLRENAGTLSIKCADHIPDFPTFIEKIDSTEVELIYVYARKDIDRYGSTTLACKLYLDDGIADVTPHWATDHESEKWLSGTLVVPLLENGLSERCYAYFNENKIEPLFDGSGVESALNRIQGLGST